MSTSGSAALPKRPCRSAACWARPSTSSSKSQMENLQSGDRFYYLQRLDGLHLFGEMENNSFAAHDHAQHRRDASAVGRVLDARPDPRSRSEPGSSTTWTATALSEATDPVGSGILTPLVVRNDPATAGPDTNYLRYTGGDHVVLGGTEHADTLIAGIGDDTLFGDGGTRQARRWLRQRHHQRRRRRRHHRGHRRRRQHQGRRRQRRRSCRPRPRPGDGQRRPGLHLPGHRHGLGSLRRHRQRLHLRQQERRAHPRQRGQ